MASFGGTVNPWAINPGAFFPPDRALQPEGLLRSRGVAASGFRPLRKIPHCCLPLESGPYLSPSVADHPLRPATRRSLGEPLPHQQADRTRAHLEAEAEATIWSSHLCGKTSPGISSGFPELSQSSRQVAHVLLTRSPLYSRPKPVSRSTCMC